MALTRRELLASGGAAALFAVGCRARVHDADVREVADLVPGLRTRDGAGVSLRRTVGSARLPLLDPFLLLDEIHSRDPADWQAGFPEHPHRGFETVSYLIDGRIEHADSVGHRGAIGPGAAQWMTAGHGIVHSEMPRQEAGLDLWGLQLWVNLPAADKMRRPRYQELRPGDIPELEVDGARVRVVAGALEGRRGPIDGIRVAPTFVDLAVPAGGRARVTLPPGHTAFAQTLHGEVLLGVRGAAVPEGALAVLGPGTVVSAASVGGGRMLLLAAAPIGEPVARRGPFVMNTNAELQQAFDDYRSGRLVDG
jgi:redox-sensitive bicupin YhaK (pirin superfamily)